jgi:SAM-dependent methyltransferase
MIGDLFPATVMPDRTWWHALWPDSDGVVRALRIKRGMTVVDLGCGYGHFTIAIARQVGPGRVIGFDLDPAMLEQAQATCSGMSNCDWLLGDAMELSRLMRAPDWMRPDNSASVSTRQIWKPGSSSLRSALIPSFKGRRRGCLPGCGTNSRDDRSTTGSSGALSGQLPGALRGPDIRKEYAWVPGARYRAQRAPVLRKAAVLPLEGNVTREVFVVPSSRLSIFDNIGGSVNCKRTGHAVELCHRRSLRIVHQGADSARPLRERKRGRA